MNQKKQKNPLKNFAVFSGVAIQMGLIITGGVLLGRWLDTKFLNEYSLYTVIFSLLGVFVALYNVIRQVKDFNKNE